MSFQTEYGPLHAEAVKTGPGRDLEADLLETQSVCMSIGLRPAVADLIECVKMLREARKHARMRLLRAWEGAGQDEQEWLVGIINDRGGG